MRRSIGKALWLWTPPVLALGLIFYYSSQSRLPDYLDAFTVRFGTKPLHVAGYLTLSLTLLRAFHGGLVNFRSRPTLLALITLVLTGVLDEVHQAPIPGRRAEVSDVLIDAVGFLTALTGTYLYLRLFRRGQASYQE